MAASIPNHIDSMNRTEALKIIDELVKTLNIKRHLLANGAAMKALARHFGEDEEKWELVGLLHDADYEATEKDLNKHTTLICQILKDRGVGEDVLAAIRGHGDHFPDTQRTTRLAKAMYAVDNLCGLITAAALVRPDKKLEGLTVESVLKRFKEPSFARGAKREEILSCEKELGLRLPQFIQITLAALQEIAPDLGL